MKVAATDKCTMNGSTFRAVRQLCALVALALAFAVIAAPTSVVAQTPELTQTSEFVELPGDCENDIAIYDPGVAVDCVFRLLPTVEAEEVEFAVLSDDVAMTIPCRTSGRVVRCQNVGGDFISGERRLSLSIGDEVNPDAAVLRAEWPASNDLYVSLPTTEAVTFPGVPVEVFSYPSAPIDGLFLNIRVRGSKRILESVELDVGTPTAGGENELLFDLAPGRYRMWPCIGATATDCVEEAGGQAFQVIDPEVIELVDGHNRRSGQRINVLFVGSTLGGDRDEVATIAREILGLDGPVPVTIDGTRAFEPADIADVRFGPMAIEPLASNAHKFNFWYLEADFGSELALLFDANFSDALDAFDLPNLHVTALYPDLNGVSDARATSFFGRASVPPTEQIRFGGTRVAVFPETPLLRSETLAHEWGHAIFELRDEYYGFDGRDVSLGFPNCAPSSELGAQWWTSFLGEVDPFVDEVLAVRSSYGLDPEPAYAPLADLVRIEPTLGGCYGNAGEPTAFRPSRDSLMNSEIPVFGLANRTRVESVLRRFDGSGPLNSLDDLEIACESVGDEFTCSGTLPTYVSPPERPLRVGGEECEFGLDLSSMALAGDGLDRHLVRCDGTIAPDSDPELISIQLGTVADTIDLRVLPEPPEPEPVPEPAPPVTQPDREEVAAPETTSSSGEDGDVLAGGDGGASGLIALAVGGGVLLTGVVVAGGLSLRQRRDDEQSP